MDKTAEQIVRDELQASQERVKQLEQAATDHQAMFWPNVDGSAEFHLYEIRNGKSEGYVRAHVEALAKLSAPSRLSEEEVQRMAKEIAEGLAGADITEANWPSYAINIAAILRRGEK